MKRAITGFIGGVLMLLFSVSVHATGNKTYVSYRGADTNPCTRVLPCKTITHALTVTTSPGTVDIIDSGDYDPFAINFDVTIEADPGVIATISCPCSGAAISVEGGQKVVVKNLRLMGLGVLNQTGLQQDSNTSLVLQNMYISGFHFGVLAYAGTLYSSNSTFEANDYGIDSIGAKGTIRNSVFVDNTDYGVIFNFGAWTLNGCTFSGNDAGVGTFGKAVALLSNSTLSDNNAGFFNSNSSSFTSGNNTFFDNNYDVTGAALVSSPSK
jgi:Periplasmic copper-binding protein (NosD)